MNVLVINCGSSSLKFQLFEMDTESVITSGIIERIGMEDSIFISSIMVLKIRRSLQFLLIRKQYKYYLIH